MFVCRNMCALYQTPHHAPQSMPQALFLLGRLLHNAWDSPLIHALVSLYSYLLTATLVPPFLYLQAPVFLGWLPFLEVCVELGLPLNDTWVLCGPTLANAARQALDSLALKGGPTSEALKALGELVSGGEGGEGSGSLHLPGSYPHDEWQGERIEGFVVAQGQELSEQEAARLRALRDAMAARRLSLGAVPQHLRRPYHSALKQALHNAAANNNSNGSGANGAGNGKGSDAAPGAGVARDKVRGVLVEAAATWLPHTAVPYTAVQGPQRDKLVALLGSQEVLAVAGGQGGAGQGGEARQPYLELPDGRGRLYSRRAVEALGAQRLQVGVRACEAVTTLQVVVLPESFRCGSCSVPTWTMCPLASFHSVV